MANVVTPVDSLPPLTLRNKKWCYKGEGNANVVLTVPEDRIVVRIMKDCGGEGMTASETAETLRLRVGYSDAVRRLYFAGDRDYVDVPALMSMSVEELRDVDRRIRRDRPQDRMHKSLGWTGGLVAVCPDHTVLPWPVTDPAGVSVYCAEIKPKQGWLHEADRRAVAAGEKCTFCANQYLKLIRGDVDEISRYCPLDLFSGRRDRVELAIRALCRWPQNNLKMFRDGVPVDGGRQAFERLTDDEFGRSDRFSAFVAAALLGDFDGEQHKRAASPGQFSGVVDGDRTQPCCDFDAVPMPEHCVLHKILTMQRSQSCGFADLCSAYDRLASGSAQFGHVDRLRSAAAVDGGQAVPPNPVDGYLVASTARDCSLFVTFRRATDRDGDGAVRHRFDGRSYAVCVKVADLDPKPLSTVDKHRKRNANVSIARDRYAEGINQTIV